MREAGIREARQNLSALIEEVRKGREVVITDRGRAVARLVPPLAEPAKAFRSRAEFRKKLAKLNISLSKAIIDDRQDRF